MREILFRGKRIDNGEWVESGSIARGSRLDNSWDYYIGASAHSNNLVDKYRNVVASVARGGGCLWYLIDPATIGQYTGLTDKNGKKIFEGDIVHILGNQTSENWKCVNYNALIAFLDGGFCALDGTVEDHGFRRYALARMDFDLKVIGNCHDNPELLGGADNGTS